MILCCGSVFCTRGVKAVSWCCFLSCGCLAVGAHACFWGGHTAVVRALHHLCAEYSLLFFYV